MEELLMWLEKRSEIYRGFGGGLNAASHPQDSGVKSSKGHSSEYEWLAGRLDGGDHGG